MSRRGWACAGVLRLKGLLVGLLGRGDLPRLASRFPRLNAAVPNIIGVAGVDGLPLGYLGRINLPALRALVLDSRQPSGLVRVAGADGLLPGVLSPLVAPTSQSQTGGLAVNPRLQLG